MASLDAAPADILDATVIVNWLRATHKAAKLQFNMAMHIIVYSC